MFHVDLERNLRFFAAFCLGFSYKVSLSYVSGSHVHISISEFPSFFYQQKVSFVS